MPVFRNIPDASKMSDIDILEENLYEFLRHGLIDAKAYQAVKVATPGTASLSGREVLKTVTPPGVTPGIVWESDYWAWSHEIEVASVYKNGVPATGHQVNYSDGRVTFSSAQPINSLIQAEFTYRTFQVYPDGVPFFRGLVLNEFVTDQNLGGVMKEHRVRVPCMLIECVMRRRKTGYQLGSLSQDARQDFLVHIIADNKTQKNMMVSMLESLEGMNLKLYDANARGRANDYPLTANGTFLPGKSSYPQLASLYPYRTAQFEGITASAVDGGLPYFRAVVRLSMRVII